MNKILRYPSFYLAAPILVAALVACISFSMPAYYLFGIALLVLAAATIVLADLLLGIQLPNFTIFRTANLDGTRQQFIVMLLCYLVIFFCLIDITLFPIPLFVDPTLYATMEGWRNHVRHISNLCWILPPVALIATRSNLHKICFIAVGFLFPILVIDRNRLFASLFALVLVLIMRRDPAKRFPLKLVFILSLFGAGMFSLLGSVRSGLLDGITLPFSDFYRASPEAMKWLLLYVSAGIYNFGAVLAKNYENADFLLNQLVPLNGPVATLGTDIPLDATTINVGTEFFPFLMAFGWIGVLASFATLYVMLILSVLLLKNDFSICSLLIFLRLAYVCFMSGFAPQAFTWTNFGFIGLCLLIPVVSNLLPNRLEQSRPQTSC